MKRWLLLLSLMLVASTAGGQIIRRQSMQAGPSSWLGMSLGLMQPVTVNDGTTGSSWAFGTATQYRVSLEKALQGGSSFGLAGSYASVPLTYTGGIDNATTLSISCPASCDATAKVLQLVALFHAGGGTGFHQVVEATGGATVYSNFQTQTGNQKLAPTTTDADMSFSIGYGFGYGLSPTSSLEVTQELNISIHQKTGLAASDNNTPRSSITRIALRFGMGAAR